MKRITLIIIALLYTFFFANAQGSISFEDKPFNNNVTRDQKLDSILSSQSAYTSLSIEEREVIYWINYVRLHPQNFNTLILTPFITQFPEIKSSYSRSLINDLATIKPSQILLPIKKLNSVANKHATDLGSTGSGISHSSSKGASFKERMNEEGLTNCVAENVYEGKKEGLKAVIFLLIDNGVQSLGHRKNILAPDYKFIGVAFHPIKRRNASFYLVQNFSCE